MNDYLRGVFPVSPFFISPFFPHSNPPGSPIVNANLFDATAPSVIATLADQSSSLRVEMASSPRRSQHRAWNPRSHFAFALFGALRRLAEGPARSYNSTVAVGMEGGLSTAMEQVADATRTMA